MEEDIRNMIPEESIESKINGKQAIINHMHKMIEENHRMIALGDDVEGRQRLIQILTNEIASHELEIKNLKEQQ